MTSHDDENRYEEAPATVDPVSGLDPEGWKLLRAVESLTRQHGLARAQQVLAQALWRCSVGHPSLMMTVDFDTSALVLRDGGRDIRAEIRFFPPGLPSLRRER